MMARIIVCVSLLGALVLPQAAVAGQSPRTRPAGLAVAAEGNSTAVDSAPRRTYPNATSREIPGVCEEACDDCAGYEEPGCCDEPACDSRMLDACCSDLCAKGGMLDKNAYFVQSWLDQGFTFNPANPVNRFNTPVTFNDRANEYQMNQLYVALGRRADCDPCRVGWGGRVDLLYGTDYYFTTAAGLETYENGVDQRWNTIGPRAGGTAALYGLAMPQLYGEFYLPWRYGMSVKVGHFDTILGYESVMAPQNFFYSHSYVMQYGEPKTHTGFLATYQYTPRIAFHAGLTRGWDSWDDPTDRPAFLGGASWPSCDGCTNVCFSLHAGDEHIAGENNRTSYSLVLMQQLSCRWRYVFQHDFGVQSDGAIGPNFQYRPARWYGFNQYLFYCMSDVTSLGFRFEWFRDEENSRVLGVPIAGFATGKNYYEASLGLNWRPNCRWTLRPEVRWDWSDVSPGIAHGMYNDFLDKNQFTFATDLVYLF